MNGFRFFAVPIAAAGLNENASLAGIVALQGMLTIFLVLAILWAAIEIVHRLLHGASRGTKTSQKSQISQKEATPAGNAQDAAIAAAIAAALAANEDEGAVVAAITAAVTAYRAEQGESGDFRVVSFKRRENVRKRF